MATTYHEIELDLEHNIYWLQADKLRKLKKAEIAKFAVGQKLNIRDLLQRWYGSDLLFGFGNEVWDFEDDEREDSLNHVLETVVRGKDKEEVSVEYLRCEESRRSPVTVDGDGCTAGYLTAMPSCVRWDVDCFFRDTFILKGAARGLVKEKDFNVCYDPSVEGESLSIGIGSMKLQFGFDSDLDDMYWSIDVLGWEIEEKDDCTVLKVDLAASVCAAGLNKSDGYNPYSDSPEEFSGFDDFDD